MLPSSSPMVPFQIHPKTTFLAGVNLRRDAPRDLDLRRVNQHGIFQLVRSNDPTLGFVEPFVSLDGNLTRDFHYDLGVQREEVSTAERDRSACPPEKSAVFLVHTYSKLGYYNFAGDAEFVEYVIDAGRRESEIRRLDIRSEFIGEEEV